MQLILRRLFLLRAVSWRRTIVLMLFAWLIPFSVHLLPWSGEYPLSAHLLPAFWTAFVAVYLYGAGAALLVAVAAAALNSWTTGHPIGPDSRVIALELVAFVGFAAALVQRWPSLRLTAPLAWVLAMMLSIAVQWTVPAFGYARSPVEHFLAASATALAGLALLLALNAALVNLLPKDADWDAE